MSLDNEHTKHLVGEHTEQNKEHIEITHSEPIHSEIKSHETQAIIKSEEIEREHPKKCCNTREDMHNCCVCCRCSWTCALFGCKECCSCLSLCCIESSNIALCIKSCLETLECQPKHK